MKFFSALLILAMLYVIALDASAQTSDAEKNVLKLERAWLDAYEKHDTAAMKTIVADDFVITFPDGSRQTKPQILTMIAAPLNAENANKITTTDVSLRRYGDTIILTGIVATEYTRVGKPVKELSSYTDTYVRRNGRWQVVASHLSNAPAPR